jgi:hypothetical protein
MKALIIKSAGILGVPLVGLFGCASENLRTNGLDPASSVNPVSPGNPTGPTMMTPGATTMTPSGAAGDDSSEGNPDGITLDPSGQDDGSPDDSEGQAGVVTPAEIGGDLEGFLHLAPCESQDFGHDCTLPGCQGGAKLVERTLELGGETGTVYDLTVHVYGVVEPRPYQGGERRAGPNFDVNGLDFWHAGGVIPAVTGTYNTYELHVEPPVSGAPNVYYLNSRTGTDEQLLIRLDYEATFPVQGAGTVRFRSSDSNCRQITNCRTNDCGPLNPKPLEVASVRNADPPPMAFTQPYQSGANVGLGQWVYVDVVDVAARP